MYHFRVDESSEVKLYGTFCVRPHTGVTLNFAKVGLAAIRWIESAFGFASESVHPNADGTIAHAEIRCGADLVMVGSLPKEGEDRLTGPSGHASLYVAVDDTGRYFEGAKAAGATVVQAPHDTSYGSRGDFTVIDPEGHWWSFGTYRP